MYRSLVLLIVLISAPAHAGTPAGDARFVPDAQLIEARSRHSATLLPDGRVVVAGGATRTGAIEGIEIYDPAARRFAAVGRLELGRTGHTATLLADGRFLFAGGFDANGGPLAEIERFDPATGRSEIVAFLRTPQGGHTATLLPNGRVLVAGGLAVGGSAVIAAAPELFDPATGRSEPAGDHVFANALYPSTRGPIWPRALPLPGGDVLLVGNAAAERYVLATGTFRAAGLTNDPNYRWGMYGHTATALADGSVLVTGGSDDWKLLDATERYDVASERFLPSARMAQPRGYHTATLLRDGRVLLVGGETSVPYGSNGWSFGGSVVASEIYVAATDTFVAGPPLTYSRSGHTATRLLDDSVLIVGGFSYGAYFGASRGIYGAVAQSERYVAGTACAKRKPARCTRTK